MLEKAFSLFERLVVAFELIARALNNNVVVTSGETAEAVADLKQTAQTTEPPADEPLGQDDAEPDAAPQDTGGSSTTVSSGEWNPYAEDFQGRYGADKITILRRECDAHGLEWFDSYPGKKLHEMLKEKGAPADGQKPDTPASEPQQEQPTQTTGQATDEVDKETLKKILLNGASTIGQPAVQDAMEKACGHRKLSDIPADKYVDVANAVKEAVGNA